MNLEDEARKFMETKNKSTITAEKYQEGAKATAIYPKKDALGLTKDPTCGNLKKII